MVDALRTKIRSIDQNQRRASAALVELQRAVSRGSTDEVNRRIDDMGGMLETLKESVDQFQVPRDLTRASDTRVAASETDTKAPSPVGASRSA
jgi:hypothetical protein